MASYKSLAPASIPEDRPKRVEVPITVPHAGRTASVSVTVDLAHDRPSDLRLWLVTPSGRPVLLRGRHRGAFGPEAIDVPQAAGEPLAGRWLLRVDDVKPGDGGTVRGWQLEASTYSAPLLIELVFGGGLTDSQKDVFRAAQERLQRILTGTKSEALTCRVDAAGEAIDGPGGTLGMAGPTSVRGSDGLPTRGVMTFDSSDIAGMERDGSLGNVLIHELAHVLGFGTLFAYHSLTNGPIFVGASAMREYGELLRDAPTPVPLEEDGGPGTAGGHWDEEVFGSELLTGWIDAGLNPISRVSVGAFDDLGYDVDMSQVDPYVLGMRRLMAGPARLQRHGCRVPDFEVV